MPLYDFACPGCGAVFEDMAGVEETNRPCPVCGGMARRLISAAAAYRADAPWIASVTAVAEKGSGKAHVDAFLADPCRDTYRAWLAGERLRPLETGEGRRPPPAPDPAHAETLRRFRARRAAC